MVKAYFENIHLQIIYHIENAQSDIKICVAWFTDYEIYSKLVEKLKEGLNIEVIVANHKFNKKSRVDYKEFLKFNGKVGYIGNLDDSSRDSLMHNKFCIIDNNIVITGSYNWSFKARTNDENILIIKNDRSLTEQFENKFSDLKPQFGFAIKNNKVALLPIENIMAKWDKKTNSEIPLKNSSRILDKF
ncbi:phospholipase D-like domain-containing protein [Arenibacter sp. M-2]|uniref:phospholipase D-like domain-containing protein n=1 Tax=Arenibacter sp. M-2 TaxID=3053612 RepID=UPI00257068E3|nr:phospholipase D-like domain-containing protein [Arenibacter sp. M-2]MDL5514815.1 phospholipase D-like domain-containing protein [Arenibacter sp. M-2]